MDSREVYTEQAAFNPEHAFVKYLACQHIEVRVEGGFPVVS